MVEMMHAVLQQGFGAPDVLQYGQAEVPALDARDVLVRNRAAGINPVDWKSRQSGRRPTPFIPGWDIAGVIEAVGAKVDGLQVGDEVFGMPRFPNLAGAYAEYVAAPGSQLAVKPPALDWVHAAALPLAGLTAYRALTGSGHLESGQRVLIHAAAGGVGHLAVQIAAALGATVIGTASPDAADLLTGYGAAQVVDYHSQKFWEVVEPVHTVLDLVGDAETAERSIDVIQDGGAYVCVPRNVHAAAAHAAAARHITTAGFFVSPSGVGMRHLADLAADGRLTPNLQQVFPLKDAAAAHAAGERGRNRGKLVLSIDA